MSTIGILGGTGWVGSWRGGRLTTPFRPEGSFLCGSCERRQRFPQRDPTVILFGVSLPNPRDYLSYGICHVSHDRSHVPRCLPLLSLLILFNSIVTIFRQSPPDDDDNDDCCNTRTQRRKQFNHPSMSCVSSALCFFGDRFDRLTRLTTRHTTSRLSPVGENISLSNIINRHHVPTHLLI